MLSGRSPAKAWVIFNGERDTTGATSTANTNRQIVASYNVTSVSRVAAGQYRVNVPAGVLPDVNYLTVMSSIGQGYASRDAAFTNTATQAGLTTRALQSPGTLADVAAVDVAIFD